MSLAKLARLWFKSARLWLRAGRGGLIFVRVLLAKNAFQAFYENGDWNTKKLHGGTE